MASNKGNMGVVHSSAFVSCLCIVLTGGIIICPRYAFGQSDDLVASVLGAIYVFVVIISLLNAICAIVVLVADPSYGDWSYGSAWFYVAILLLPILLFLMPAIATA